MKKNLNNQLVVEGMTQDERIVFGETFDEKNNKQNEVHELPTDQMIQSETSEPSTRSTNDKADEEVISTVLGEHEETFNEPTQDGVAANDAAAPTLSPVEELSVAGDDLFKGASFPTAQKSPIRTVGSALAVINHKNGKRIKFSEDIEIRLQLEEGDTVNIAVKSNEIIFIKTSSGSGFGVGAKRTIYGTELVELITRQFQLDFSVASTQHLMNVDFKNYKGQVVAIITK